MMTRAILNCVLASYLLVGAVSHALAQNLEDALRQRLAPPETVVRYADSLNIDEEQEAVIFDSIKTGKAAITEHELALLQAKQNLLDAVGTFPTNVETVLTRFDRVADLETKIKKAHLRLWIEVNNALREEQRQRILHEPQPTSR